MTHPANPCTPKRSKSQIVHGVFQLFGRLVLAAVLQAFRNITELCGPELAFQFDDGRHLERDIKRDSVSSGERTRKRANRKEKSFWGMDRF